MKLMYLAVSVDNQKANLTLWFAGQSFPCLTQSTRLFFRSKDCRAASDDFAGFELRGRMATALKDIRRRHRQSLARNRKHWLCCCGESGASLKRLSARHLGNRFLAKE